MNLYEIILDLFISWNQANNSLQLDGFAFVVLVLLRALDSFLARQVSFLRETEITNELAVHLKVEFRTVSGLNFFEKLHKTYTER